MAGDTAPNRYPGSGLPSAFWKLWTASSMSNLADGALKIALPLIAITFTRSPTLIAGLAVALSLPWLLFALPAGACADRLDRRRAMLGANLARAAVLAALVLVFAADAGTIWLLYAVAFCIGTAETLYDTSAQSILPQVVPRALLSRANGRLHAAELTTNQFIGPPLGGFLVAAGAMAALAAPAALWLVAVAALALVPGSFRMERTQATTVRADIAEGLRFLWRNRILRTLAVMVGVFNFASSAAWPLLVLFAVGPASPMGLPEPGYAVLLATVALGAIVGSLTIAEWTERRLGRSRSLMLATVGSAVPLATPAFTTSPYLIGGAFFIMGVALAIWNVISVSLRQRITPDRILGRVNSGYRLLAWGTMPLGAATGGLLAELFGIRPVFAAMALLTLCLLVGMRVITDQRLDATERDGVRDHSES